MENLNKIIFSADIQLYYLFLIISTVANAETPSSLPTNPSFSVVVAFIETWFIPEFSIFCNSLSHFGNIW